MIYNTKGLKIGTSLAISPIPRPIILLLQLKLRFLQLKWAKLQLNALFLQLNAHNLQLNIFSAIFILLCRLKSKI